MKKFGASEGLAKEATNVTNYMWGGNLMLIPVGLMEHFRTPIVKMFNRMAKDPTDPKSIEDAPPQTTGSILKGRLNAWATVFAGFTGVRYALGDNPMKACSIKLVVSGPAFVKNLGHSNTGVLPRKMP